MRLVGGGDMENIGTIGVILILVLLVVFAIRYMIKEKKKGKVLSCDGNCENCSGCNVKHVTGQPMDEVLMKHKKTV